MKSRVSVVLAMAALAVVALPTVGSANLLVQGGFEVNNLAPLGTIVYPLTPALWGHETSTDVTVGQGGITPRTGSWMLDMGHSSNYTQALQFVDITAYATLQAEAYFNSDAPGAMASIVLAYYTDAINGWNNMANFGQVGLVSHSLTLDSNTTTWESISFVSTKPAGATWVGFQVAYYEPSIQPDYAGYVDDASLDGKVPEPGSLLALGTGLLGFCGLLRRGK